MPNVFILKDHLPKMEKFPIDIHGTVYELPHYKMLGRKDVQIVRRIQDGDSDAIYDFIGRHIGQEVADELSYGELEAIFTAWSQSIHEEQGVTLGES